MTRYEQWRVNPSSVPPQALASHPVLQPLVAHRSINSHGTNTPTSSSTPSSSRSRASISLRSRTPSPYEQSPTEDDRARRERVDALLREDPRRREDVYPADGARADQWHARGDDARQRHEWEEEGRRRVAEQRRLEQEGILRRQREAEHAAQAARFGQPNGQSQGVTGPVMPVSSPVQYPSISASVTTASAPSGPITGYLQMPLESPTRCVIFWGLETLSWYLNDSNTVLAKTNLTKGETFFPPWLYWIDRLYALRLSAPFNPLPPPPHFHHSWVLFNIRP
jgi:STAM-binding protein